MKRRRSAALCRRLMNSAILMSILSIVLVGCRTSKPIGLLGARAIVPPPCVEPTGMSSAPSGSAVEPLPGESLIVTDLPPPVTPGMSLGTAEGRTPEEIAPQEVEIVLPPAVESQVLTYTVKKGDSLWEIARMYGITHQELASYNKLDEKAILKVGQVLNIPPGGHYIPPENRPKVKPRTKKAASTKSSTKTHSEPSVTQKSIPGDGKYTVKAGDSLWKIARDHGLKSTDIRQLNNLKTDVLQIGQVLLLPAGAASPASPPKKKTDLAPTLTPTLLKSADDTPASRLTVPTPPEKTVAPTLTTGAADDVKTAVAPAETGTTETTSLTTATAPEKTAVTEPIKLTADPLATFPKKLDHLVSKGETLKMIAEMYGTTVEAIVKENPQIKTDADLKPSMKIMVPYR